MTANQFTQMVMQHDNAMRNFAMKFTKDVDDANDLMQDTLIKAIRHFTQFEQDTNIKGWLFTIMRNTFINNYRKDLKTRAFITQSDEFSSADLKYRAAKNQAENTFVMGDIKHSLATLPAWLSTPFIRYVEGYKYHEIAIELDIPLGTVKTRIHEARRCLKKQLQMYKDRH